MPDAAPIPSPSRRGRHLPGLVRRALAILGFGATLGAAIAVLNRQDFVKTEVYSLAIALACWACIDGGRRVIGRLAYRLQRRSGGGAAYDDRDWPGWPLMLLTIVVGSVAGYSAGNEFGDLVYGYVPQNPLLSGDLRDRLGHLLWSTVPAIAVTYFMYTRATIANHEAAAQAALRQAAESRLKLLESQLEPHMLFNTLANLRVLIGVDPARAQQMLDQLIAFLRSTLAGSRAQWHPLGAEFARLADYLALMKVRMDGRLATGLSLPQDLAAVPVPPLLLQPLVENSIRHGLEPAVAGGRVDIGARRDGTQLVLTVRDTGVGFDGARIDASSFGLAHVRERLATLYGARASLTVERLDGGGTLATLTLPCPPA